MKTIIASLAAVAALATVSTGASAGGHGHGHHHHHGYYAKPVYAPVYAPVYVAPTYSCKIVYHHGHAQKTCFKVYGH